MFKRFTLFLLFSPLMVCGQLTTEVAVLYEQLNTPENAKKNYIGTKTTRNSFDSEFQYISGIASDADLQYIATNGTSIMKNYALKELVERKSTYLTELFSQYLLSTEQFKVHTGILVSTSNLATQLFYNVAHQKEKALRKQYYDKTTTKGQQTELKTLFGREYNTIWKSAETDSLLVKFTDIALANDNTPVETLRQIFYIRDYKSNNYKRVRYFANKYPEKEILAGLANYKNADDVPLLQQNFDKAFLAISRFPHAAFLPKLKLKANTEYENHEFQQAVVAYKNKESEAILETVRKQIIQNNPKSDVRGEKLYQLYGNIERKSASVYNALLLRIENSM